MANKHKLKIDRVLYDGSAFLFMVGDRIVPFALEYEKAKPKIESVVKEIEATYTKSQFFNQFMTVPADKTPLSENHEVIYSREG